MALNIKDPETEALASEVARLTGDTKTGAVRAALREQRRRLRLGGVGADPELRMRRLLEDELWPALGVTDEQQPMTKAEREATLGLGPNGH